ncbi:hypothetical protein C1H46_027715 [Malus baccata]|uniref:Uncharacterized protein n=1 Tax=Malus baccata TaxID=106549 RepID=A0A540LK59_MALBA|nr:hypothetical protein C1H46_027715 [Malus baccata]
MGANQSNCKPSSLSYGGHGGGNSSSVPSIMELLKPDCLKSENKKRKRQLAPEKKNIYNNYTKNTGIVGAAGSGTRMTTLEEWLLASPGHVNADRNYNISGGELYVFRPSSKRIHPAASSSSKLPPLSKAKDSFCLERLVKNDDNKSDEANLIFNDISASMSCRSINTQLSENKTRKLKKKVSFRLPEEADIFIFYPSEDNITTDDNDNDEDFD